MLRDVELFQAKLAKLDGFGDAGEFLANIVKSKEMKSVEPVVEQDLDKANVVEPDTPEASSKDTLSKPGEDGAGAAEEESEKL